MLTLPNGTAADVHDIDLVCDIIEAALEQAEEIRERLSDGLTTSRA